VKTTLLEVSSKTMQIKHKHHIVPKYMGGSDDPSNLIELTIEEHAQAHLELYNKFGNKQDLIAYRALSGQMTQAEALLEKNRLGGITQGNRNKESGQIYELGKRSYPMKEHVKKQLSKSWSRSGNPRWAMNKYIAFSPTGEEFIILEGWSKFCAEHGLHTSKMNAVAKGTRKQHKGWTCKFYEETSIIEVQSQDDSKLD
jgi:hypothetical protein